MLNPLLTSLVLAAGAAPAYVWSGTTTLTASDGAKLVWTVKQGDTVEVDASHPKWSFHHVAKPDGTPVSTVKKSGARTVRIDYRDGEATYAVAGVKPKLIKASNLWDADALDARLAGIDWARVHEVEFNVIDSDSEDGDVYPMVAADQGLESCAAGPCRHVKLTLSGFRKPFGPTVHFHFGTTAGAPYFENDNDGHKFTLKAEAAR